MAVLSRAFRRHGFKQRLIVEEYSKAKILAERTTGRTLGMRWPGLLSYKLGLERIEREL